MTLLPHDVAHRRAGTKPSPAGALACALLALVAMAAFSGCGGCWSADAEAAKKADKKPDKPKPDFEPPRSDTQPPAQDEDDQRRLKPGHFTLVALDALANNFDFQGQLETAVVDVSDQPVDLERTVYNLAQLRPAILPKGQAKQLEVVLFPPRGRLSTSVLWRLRDANRLGETLRHKDSFNHMPAYQYNLIVLARDPERYRYLKELDSVRTQADDFVGSIPEGYYRVTMPPVGKRIPLPGSVLYWTNIAYLVWDDVDPALLRAEQREALVDWLHWGGQLIVSGPNSLDALAGRAGEFLQPYLPATATGATALEPAALAPLFAAWTLSPGRAPAIEAKWTGVTLVKDPAAAFLPGTGELVAERRVGRGRIVVTAFRLVEPELVRWRGFDNFFNACLLRRGPRTFTASAALGESATIDWADHPGEVRNPAHVTGLRFASRDPLEPFRPRLRDSSKTAEIDQGVLWAVQRGQFPEDLTLFFNDLEYEPAPPPVTSAQDDPALTSMLTTATPDELPAKRRAGTAGWNDFSPVANAARRTLRAAAGIRVPQRQFIVGVLAAYLVVIVPLNWLVFRLIGRVEWAWLAVPVIAVGCGVAVVHLAQLDIGFARALNEVGLLEVHAGHPRAHLTRYSALYSSLSTHYDATLDDPTAVVLPFAVDESFTALAGQARTSVTFRADEQAVLSGFQVASNTTGMLHSEQMIELGGAFTVVETPGDGPRLCNGSKLALQDVRVLRLADAGGQVDVAVASVGTLPAGGEARLDFALAAGREARTPQFAGDTIDVGQLLEVCMRPQSLRPGELRLVGVIRAPLPGLSIAPAAAQARSATVAIVHLAPPALAAARSDTNARHAARSPAAVPPDGQQPTSPPAVPTPATIAP